METETVKTFLVRIEGRVQGVFFRAWTVEEAQARNLAGWVRNRRDGSVEALFSGAAADVDDMVQAARRGPPMAAVSHVKTQAAEPPEEAGFEQWGTV